jgi:hypothetical protein
VTMSADEFTPPSNGTVSVLATTFGSSFGSQSWLRTTPVQIRLAPELLTVSSYVLNSNSNATLWIRNDGPLRVLINQYNVTDSLGNSYYWCLQSYVACGSSPLQINSASIGGLNVLVGTSCTTAGGPPRCSVHGTQFTFQTGHSYTVTVQTSRYNLFTKVISF